MHIFKILDPSETMSGLECIEFTYSFMQSVGALLSRKVCHLDLEGMPFEFHCDLPPSLEMRGEVYLTVFDGVTFGRSCFSV